ncbi:MAG: polymorphic toxin-type HINT domain-containing protein [Candidatus Cloacimonetes bacterium]|nr:polymorphic toxin-type HINT domain-containing protein [Candidatus Cloacimonadota bacterium]
MTTETHIWLSVDPLSDKYPSLSPYAYCANNPVILKDPNGMSIDEWDFDVETGKSTYVSNKGGDNTQHINFKYKGETISTSFATTKSEANVFRESMNNRNESWELVGMGLYMGGSFAGVGGAQGRIGNYTIFSESNKTFDFKDFGSNFGYDFGVSAGVLLIYGSSDFKGTDLEGYSAGFNFGAHKFEGSFQTSATEKGTPTFNYGVVSFGAAYSVLGGGFGVSRTTVKERETNLYYGPRPGVGYCFAAGTLIYMKNEFKEIQDIKVGDSICSYDIENDLIHYSVVTKAYVAESDSIYKLNISGNEIFVTAQHPFYVKDKGWILTKDLDIGDAFFSGNNEKIALLSKENISWKSKVYNLEVDGFHNYFITNKKVLVHNK